MFGGNVTNMEAPTRSNCLDESGKYVKEVTLGIEKGKENILLQRQER